MNLYSQIPIAPMLPDLEASIIEIKDVDDRKFTFTYQIKNTGNFGPVFVSHFRFQAWVSKDPVLDATDLPAGGSNLPDNAPALSVGQTYRGTWHSEPTRSLQDYHYLILDVKLRSGFSQAEITTSNNRAAKDIAPSFPGLVLKSVLVGSIDDHNKAGIVYTIANEGRSLLHLDRFGIQAFISSDPQFKDQNNTYDQGVFSIATFDNTLAPGKSMTSSITINQNSLVNLNTHFYLCLKAVRLPGASDPQLNLKNDSTVINMRSYFADIVMSSIEIIKMHDGSLPLYCQIQNKGRSLVYIDKFVMKFYLSKDDSLSEDDIKLKETRLKDTYTGSVRKVLSTNNYYTSRDTIVLGEGINFNSYKFLICKLYVLPGEVHTLRNNINDAFALPITPNLTIEGPGFIQITGMNIKTRFNGYNAGYQDLDLRKYNYQVYLSNTIYIDNNSYLLAESAFPEGILSPGGLVPNLMVDVTSMVDPHSYQYLIIREVIKPGEIDNQFYVNSFNVGVIPKVSSTQKQAVSVLQDDQHVSILNTSTVPQNSEYVVYSLIGETVSKGTFINEYQLPLSGLRAGVYIIQVSTNGAIETHKIIKTE